MATACLGCGSWLQENHWKPDDIPRCFKCEAHALRAEVERLTAENAALRELVVDGYYEEFGDVQSEGAKKEVDRFWRKSTTKQRLDEIGKGEG